MNIRLVLSSIIITSLFSLIVPQGAIAAVPEELKKAIEEKAKGLEAINRQIAETQQQLWETEAKGKTLNQEIKRINGTVSQIGLGIKAGEINLEKLKLEIQSLSFNIEEKEQTIELKRSAIMQFLRQLQEHTHESSLLTFLKGKSLAESMLETQSVSTLNENLSKEVKELETVRKELDDALTQTSEKKGKVETETKSLKYRKNLLEDQKENRQSLLAQTKSQEQTYQKQLSELQEQQEAISEEIERIEAELRRDFDASLLPQMRSGFFSWPVALRDFGGKGRISQHFGIRSALYRGNPHNGLDIAAPMGTEVIAAEDGIVVAVDNNDRSALRRYQYGKYIMIKHENGFSTLYAHLSGQVVKIGDSVKRGQLIGYVGNTGYSTGPHLHFGLYWAPTVTFRAVPPAAGLVPIGVLANPEDYL